MPARIMWFRRDLRLADNPALSAAADAGGPLVSLFVLDPALLGSTRMGAPRLAYLRDALTDLDGRLRDAGSRLLVRHGDPRTVVPEVAGQAGADRVHCTADVTPASRRRDAATSSALDEAGRALVTHDGVLVHAPGRVVTRGGEPYKVFTPFFDTWADTDPGGVLPAPTRLPGPPSGLDDEPPDAALEVLDVPRGERWLHGGETAAWERARAFLDDGAADYHDIRDRLDVAGTSRWSADLKYGCVSPRSLLDHLDRRRPGHLALARQLAWRDFAGHVMHAWPEVTTTEFDPRMRALPWRDGGSDLQAWQEGRTGYPVVDAALRQLLAEGWVHNRGRLLAASFLCKDLLIDWRAGEAHFLRHLIDGDIASNNLGWQWAAGTGTDAQPYFRIFNPATQGRRFDPDGTYVRTYVPELAAVPTRFIHAPWAMPDEVAADCGVRIGDDYPHPLVDHADARREALDWFDRHRRA